MTYSELVRAISAILPDATFGEDNEGQLVVYTNLQQTNPSDDAELKDFEAL